MSLSQWVVQPWLIDEFGHFDIAISGLSNHNDALTVSKLWAACVANTKSNLSLITDANTGVGGWLIATLLLYNVWGTLTCVHQCRSAYINGCCSLYQKGLPQTDFDKSISMLDALGRDARRSWTSADTTHVLITDKRTSIWPSWCSTHETSPQVRGSSATIICHTTVGSIGSAKLCSKCTFNA